MLNLPRVTSLSDLTLMSFGLSSNKLSAKAAAKNKTKARNLYIIYSNIIFRFTQGRTTTKSHRAFDLCFLFAVTKEQKLFLFSLLASRLLIFIHMLIFQTI